MSNVFHLPSGGGSEIEQPLSGVDLRSKSNYTFRPGVAPLVQIPVAGAGDVPFIRDRTIRLKFRFRNRLQYHIEVRETDGKVAVARIEQTDFGITEINPLRFPDRDGESHDN